MKKSVKSTILNKITILFITCVMLACLSGCNKTDEEDALGADMEKTSDENEDEYSKYIREAMQSVSPDVITPTPAGGKDDGSSANEQTVLVTPPSGDSIYVSASEQLPEDSGVTPDFASSGSESSSGSSDADSADSSSSSSSSSDSSGGSSGSESSTGPAELTPDTFDVGTCCIYINGEDDSSYGSDIITAINKARTDLGYTALNEKTGLDTCANRRTREIASYLSHMRPNATPFYSLAPQYFKAEMLAIDGADASETVDAWIRDPVSRSLIFTNKYSSIGASCFKCNTLNCVVVAFGY